MASQNRQESAINSCSSSNHPDAGLVLILGRRIWTCSPSQSLSFIKIASYSLNYHIRLAPNDDYNQQDSYTVTNLHDSTMLLPSMNRIRTVSGARMIRTNSSSLTPSLK